MRRTVSDRTFRRWTRRYEEDGDAIDRNCRFFFPDGPGLTRRSGRQAKRSHQPISYQRSADCRSEPGNSYWGALIEARSPQDIFSRWRSFRKAP
jgi:hypothetical protein